jgi:hypothetical protein
MTMETFNIYLFSDIATVQGERIKHPFGDDIVLFIHEYKGAWHISEYKTGLLVEYGDTREEAIDKLVNSGVRTRESLLAFIEDWLGTYDEVNKPLASDTEGV